MKKILVMLLVICLAASMVACGNRNTEGNNTNVENNGGTGVNDGVGDDADAVPHNNVDNAIDTVPDDTVPGNNPMDGTDNNTINNDNAAGNVGDDGVTGTDKDGVIENMGEDIKDGAENIKEDVKDNAENR